MTNNILFIDDDENVIEGYKHIFNRPDQSKLDELSDLLELSHSNPSLFADENYRIFTASGGLNGIDIVEQQYNQDDPIKVAFIDMRMPPGIDGAETARMIARIDPNVEIVIVTAYSDTKLHEINEIIGRSDKLLYLKKPFDPMEIRQLALNLCRKYELERLKDEFIGNVSHELMTPLSSILGFSDILMNSHLLAEEDIEPAKIINRNSILMRDLIDDLLSIARLEKTQVDLVSSTIDVNDFLYQIKNVCAKIINENGHIKFSTTQNSKNLTMTCDVVKIERVLINLITNAYKFTKNGEIAVAVEITDDEFCFSVSDTGIGIPDENIKNIFDKFKRLENRHHSIPGLGLGLSIVDKIVEAHGGKVSVNSEVGKGSKFTIHFSRDSKFRWR